MNAKDMLPIAGDAVVDDLGPLAWVLDELRKSLDAAAKALKRFVREAEAAKGSDLATLDASQLRIARQQLHQAVGALEMVGLSGPALVLRAMESAVQKFVQQPEHCNQEGAGKIEGASFALAEYLEGVLGGKSISAISLFPQYRDVQELARADRIHPADLWLNEWRWLEPAAPVKSEPRNYDSDARNAFDQSLLQILRGQTSQAGSQLAALSVGFAARQEDQQARIFWKLSAAFFEALANELIEPDIYVRRAASRILLQYASLSKGDIGVSDRLAHDLLFFCAQASVTPLSNAPMLASVQQTYGLARHKPVSYLAVQFGRFDPAQLAQARKRISTAKESWSSLSAGDVSKLKTVTDQFSLISDSLIKLHPTSEPLALALSRAIEVTVRSAQPPSIELAMEVATSVLYLEAAFEDLDPNDTQLAGRTLHLSERLESVKNGGAAQPLEPWMEDLYRRVSDKQTMGSVVGELRVSLGELERSLDAFFRHPEDKTVLTRVPTQLAQMRGVLSVLGLDQASQAVIRMRDSVEQMLETDIDEERARAAGTFDQLGNNLGALSFLIDMLNYQPVLAKKLFVYDEAKGELRPLMGRTEKAQIAASVPAAMLVPLPMQVAAVVSQAPSAFSDSITAKLDALAINAELAGHAELAKTAQKASRAASAHDVAATTQAFDMLAASVAPASTVSASAIEVMDFEEADLRDIFLDEAREVASNGVEAIRLLKIEPADISQLTILRRVFHTLKGSARMVGLNEFGEAGWAMEQLFNGWLADQKPATEELLRLSDDSLAGFRLWIEDIDVELDAAWSAAAFRASADAMRTEGRVVALMLPTTNIGLASLPSLPAHEQLSPPHVAIEQTPSASDNVASGLELEPAYDYSTGAAAELSFDLSDLGVQSLPHPPPDTFTRLLAADIQPSGITNSDAGGLSVLSGVPGAASDFMVLPPSLSLFPANAATSSEMSETLEIEALQRQLDEFELGGLDAVAQLQDAAVEPASLELSPEDFDAQFFTPQAAAQSAGPEQLAAAQFDNVSDGYEQVKIIGDLRIGIPLYNVYLNEADEWSRRLVTELTEWAIERKDPINDTTVSFAHSLAGSSATVGFTSLSEIARALEHALLQSQAHYAASASAQYADVFLAAAEDIRRLLHQFAAGFLKDADTVLIGKLNALEFTGLDSEPSKLDGIDELVEVVELLELADVPFESALTEAPLPDVQAHLHAEGTAEKVEDSLFSLPARSVAPIGSLAALVVAPALASIAAFHAINPSPTALQAENADDEIDAVDAIDAELFPIFDEEAAELMPQLGGALRQWSARPDNLGARLEVLRALHTLKGSARLAGALRLGEMAHHIESQIELLGTDTATSQELDPLLARYDGMQQALDALRAGDVAAPGQAFGPLVTNPEATTSSSTMSPMVLSEQSEPVVSSVVTANVGVPISDNLTGSVVAQLATSASAGQVVGTLSAKLSAASPSDVNVGGVMIPAPQTMAMQPLRQAATASIRVRSQLLDRMVNQAGEVMITRSRLEVELNQLRGSLGDMTDNLNRLRQQLRDIELQAETQMQSRLAQAKELQAGFDPLEFDRFTRVQELTRMMAESVNDVATVQRTLQRTVEATEDDLIAQARQTRELQRDLLKTRMVEFEGISDRLYRVVRQASKDTGKQVKLDLLGGTIEMDRGMLDRMTPAFEHLLRNCVAHGIEAPEVRQARGKDVAGLITVHLRQEGNDVSVEFSDDGAGLDLTRIREKAVSSGLLAVDQIIDDQQAADLIFTPGFTTAAQVSELAGRGIGMDVVRTEVNSVGGRIETSSVAGKGTHFKLVLPLTTAVTQVVMIRSGNLTVGVPATIVETVRRTTAKELQQAYNAGTLDVAGEGVPFFWSGALLQSSSRTAEAQGKTTSVVVFRSAAQRVALHVDEVLGNQEVVVKNLGPQLSRLPGLAGMSVLASGAVVLIYNPVALASVYGTQARIMSADRAESHMLEASASSAAGMETTALAAPAVPLIPLVMVVDDSITVRRVTQRLLQREGYRVVLAADGLQALERLQEERPSVVLSDIEMPRMDGFDLARNIRADAILKDLPIVMITSRIAEKHREYAKELGVNHYLGKPYPEDELMSLVKQYCRVEARA